MTGNFYTHTFAVVYACFWGLLTCKVELVGTESLSMHSLWGYVCYVFVSAWSEPGRVSLSGGDSNCMRLERLTS